MLVFGNSGLYVVSRSGHFCYVTFVMEFDGGEGRRYFADLNVNVSVWDSELSIGVCYCVLFGFVLDSLLANLGSV